MALKDLHRKLKAFRVNLLFLTKDGHSDRGMARNNQSWMAPVSHGIQVVEHLKLYGVSDDHKSEPDFAVAQREQIKSSEVWFFGIFDPQIGDKVTKYFQANLFDKDFKESKIKRRGKETMERAFILTRAKLREEKQAAGCASAIVINGEKIVAANMGDYRVVACKEGVADQICERHHPRVKSRWSLNLFSGTLQMRVRTAGSKPSKHSGPVVAVENIDFGTEFIILASNGIWEVMKNQEAVNLIRHINDPEEAAECLAKEALTRLSKGSISCLVIRFD